MPNIELHSFAQDKGDVEKQIFKALAKKKYLADCVVTIVDSYCVDKDGNRQPFIRIYDTGEDLTRSNDSLNTLKALNIGDIEVVELKKFIQKEGVFKKPSKKGQLGPFFDNGNYKKKPLK